MKELPSCRKILDLGAGTGDLSFLTIEYCQKQYGHEPFVVGVDLSHEMLAEAKSIARADPKRKMPEWIQASAEALPCGSAGFEVVVSSFVLRNLQRAGVLRACVAETFRVLQKDGCLLWIDLTKPVFLPFRCLHSIYMNTVVPLVGRLIFGKKWPGAYLKTSIDELLPADQLTQIFLSCGFSCFEIRPYYGGLVSLFMAKK